MPEHYKHQIEEDLKSSKANNKNSDLDIEHDIQDVDMSHYTKQMWFYEIKVYLVDVMGMNKKQVKQHFDKNFADLLERGLEL